VMGERQRARLLSTLSSLLSEFGVPVTQVQGGFDELAEAYAGPGRFYHNLDHIRAVLDTVDSLGDLARDLPAVRLAAWYHDAVYDSRAKQNEERSADLAAARCRSWGVPAATFEAVRRLILATRDHQADAAAVDGHVLLDPH